MVPVYLDLVPPAKISLYSLRGVLVFVSPERFSKRIYQRECLDAWKNNHYRGIANVVTGAGKTFLALAAIAQARALYPDLMVRIVVPTIPLAHQWEMALLHQSGPDEWRPGFFGGGKRDDPDRHVIIYIINSARDSLAGHIRRDLALQRHVLLICDECHHYTSKENRKIFGFLEGAHASALREKELYLCLGLSATPFGTSNDEVLFRSLGREIYQYGFDSAVNEGIISPFTVCEVSSSFYADELAEYGELTFRIGKALIALLRAHPQLKKLRERKEKSFIRAVMRIAKEADMDPTYLMLTWQRKEISTLARARLSCCLSILEQLRESDRVLIFCERIAQAEEMAGLIRRAFGNVCGVYHSQMTKEARTRILSEFREETFRILVSCKALDEGIDVPDANIGIVLSSTAVERQRIQRLGRLIRRAEGKATACLYYIYIRESTDDAAFLPELQECESFSLRYYPAEGVFSNDLYEYVSGGLVRSARDQGYNTAQLEEVRKCLTEGLVCADYLLSAKEQARRAQSAKDRHSKNYWGVMRRVGDAFRGKR